MRANSTAIRLITLTGPSGAGKTAYAKALLDAQPGWRLVASVTTRDAREKDLPGEYHARTADATFGRLEAADAFLWTFAFGGHRYGTTRSSVEDALRRETVSLMLLAPMAVPRLRGFLSGRTDAPARHVYCLAPPEEELRRRLERRRARGDRLTDGEIEARIAECRAWDAEARASGIPYLFIPGDVSIPEATALIVESITSQGDRS